MGNPQRGVDTLRDYVEICSTEAESWKAFGSMAAGVQRMGETDESIFLTHRDWLLKVLYYNPDTMYYCADVQGILSTMRRNGERGYDVNGMLTIVKFLHDENRCGHLQEYMMGTAWASERKSQLQIYDDSVTDRQLYPLDTSLLTLEELGLAKLRGNAGALTGDDAGSSPGLLSFVASENPFSTETTLSFSLGSTTLVRLGIFTVLGEEIYNTGIGQLYAEGSHHVTISASGLPQGTLYARMTTLDGEVKTLKLIKK